jgi:hypothetical protein
MVKPAPSAAHNGRERVPDRSGTPTLWDGESPGSRVPGGSRRFRNRTARLQRCPGCGRVEAPGAYCSGCGRPTSGSPR